MQSSKPSKVLIIGSGPIVIGQAAEFDYAGTQACKAMREEGVVSVLVNSNPATIMTDEGIADVVYIEPLTVEVLERIIAQERPDGLLPTLGGQTGLNLAVALADAGVLERYNVRLLGTPLDTIRKAEDRELFKELLQEIGRARAAQRNGDHAGAGASGGGGDRSAPGDPSCVYPRRHRRRLCLQHGRAGRGGRQRPGCQPNPSGAGGAIPGGLEGGRVRGDEGRRR